VDFTLTDDQAALQTSFVRLLASEASVQRARQSEPLGFDRALWSALCAFGVPAIAVPVEQGGAGGSLLDLALVAEAAGRYLAPVALVESAVGARLLSRLRSPLAAAAAEGSLLATVGLSPAVDGVAHLVPAGAIADVVVGWSTIAS
jgi:alkylation response protein AidB-like acyl-CoA dehydrogenase